MMKGLLSALHKKRIKLWIVYEINEKSVNV